MKIFAFQSEKGDCLLLQGSDGANILADGGMNQSFKTHVLPRLSSVLGSRQILDLVYVSHIDQDHIAGILTLMDALVKWRVFDYQHQSGNTHFPQPDLPRPPDIGEIWHNAFSELLGKNADAIHEQLAANAAHLYALDTSWAADLAERSTDLVNSQRQAVKLNRRIGSRQLNIPHNAVENGKLMMVDQAGYFIELGDLNITIIGPPADALKELRKEWKQWLRSQSGKKALKNIRDQAKQDEKRLGTNDFDIFVRSILAQSEGLGDKNKVTTPNIASLTLLVEEAGKTILMTGDAHSDEILQGLDATGQLDAQGRIFVNVLKVPHHGSEHNMRPDFFKRVIADHYVFCGDGAHGNPEPAVIDAFIASRLGNQQQQSTHPLKDRPFKFWFTSNHRNKDAKHASHMKKIERQVLKAQKKAGTTLKSSFLRGSHHTISL